MGIEKTYIMLKPDCVKRGLMGEVISRIERKGYKLSLIHISLDYQSESALFR